MRCRAEAAEAAQDALAKIHGRALDLGCDAGATRLVGVAVEHDDVRPPPPLVVLADTLARHAPPLRALTPSIREERAA
jgi:hypothetical protein